MELKDQWCDNEPCRDFGKVGAGNIRIHSYAEQRYCCRTCRHTFSVDKGTFFESLRSAHLTVVEVLAMLGERNSVRAVERLKHHPHNAILHWVDLAGQHGAAISAFLVRDLRLTQAQVDELWTFVKKNKRIYNQMTPWIWAICGSGVLWPCPVAYGWSAISVTSGVRPKP